MVGSEMPCEGELFEAADLLTTRRSQGQRYVAELICLKDRYIRVVRANRRPPSVSLNPDWSNNLAQFFRTIYPDFHETFPYSRNRVTIYIKLRSDSPSTPTEPIQCGQFTTLQRSRILFSENHVNSHFLGCGSLQYRFESMANERRVMSERNRQMFVWHTQEDHKVFVAINLDWKV